VLIAPCYGRSLVTFNPYAYVADAAVPAGERVFAAGLVHSCLRPVSLPPSSRVARRCPLSFRPFGGAEAEAPLG
jgi:hypothetical protein